MTRLDAATFRSELESLINRHSMENASNTPDYILAQFLEACLVAFDVAVQQRETWYGRDGRPSPPTAATPVPGPAVDVPTNPLAMAQAGIRLDPKPCATCGGPGLVRDILTRFTVPCPTCTETP